MPLSPLGREQIHRLAQWFASYSLQGIFTSNLKRSQTTAQAIAMAQEPLLSPVIEPGLGEMHLGSWEGLTPQQVDARFRGAYQQWLVRPSSVNIPGAEPLTQFRVRCWQALEKIAASFEEGTCAIVSHGGVIASLLAEVLSADYDAMLRRLRLDNAGITAIEWTEGFSFPHLLWINSTIHLSELLPTLDLPTPAGSSLLRP